MYSDPVRNVRQPRTARISVWSGLDPGVVVAHVQRLFPASLQVRVSNFDTAIKMRKVHDSPG